MCAHHLLDLTNPTIGGPRLVTARHNTSVATLAGNRLVSNRGHVVSNSILSNHRSFSGVTCINHFRSRVDILARNRRHPTFRFFAPNTGHFSGLPVCVSRFFNHGGCGFAAADGNSPHTVMPVKICRRIVPRSCLPARLLHTLVIRSVVATMSLNTLRLSRRSLTLYAFMSPNGCRFNSVLHSGLAHVRLRNWPQ